MTLRNEMQFGRSLIVLLLVDGDGSSRHILNKRKSLFPYWCLANICFLMRPLNLVFLIVEQKVEQRFNCRIKLQVLM